MAEVHDILLEARKTVFDELRTLFFETGTELHVLSSDISLTEFNVLAMLTEGWWLRYDNFRKNFLLEVVDADDEMPFAMQTATHVRVNDEVYVIDAADVTAPMGTDVTWKIRCDRFTRRSQYSNLY